MLRCYCTVVVSRVLFVVRPDTNTDGEGGIDACAKKKLTINRVVRALKKQGQLAGWRFSGCTSPIAITHGGNAQTRAPPLSAL